MISFNEKQIENEFNKFFINIGLNLADVFPAATRYFESYMQQTNEATKNEPTTINEVKDTFSSLHIYKTAGYHEINFNVIKSCFGGLCDPLKYIFNLSFKKGIFLNYIKIAKARLVFKGSDSAVVSNYRPISVLPCF